MRRILIILLTLICVTSFGQTFDPSRLLKPSGYGMRYMRGMYDSNLVIPTLVDTTNKYPGSVKVIGDDFYYVGFSGYWRKPVFAELDPAFLAHVSSSITSTNVSNWNASFAHTSNTSNPHSVTKSQVGLGNVDNTSDVNKPISTAEQTVLNTKLDTATVVGDTALRFSKNGNTFDVRFEQDPIPTFTESDPFFYDLGVKKGDSTLYSTKANVTKAKDSVVALIPTNNNQLSNGSNYKTNSDSTAATGYTTIGRSVNDSAILRGLINSNTSNIVLKINISDSAAMLANYLRSATAAATYVPLSQTASRVMISNGSGVVSTNSLFAWDNTNNRLGIGTASPTNPLHLHNTYGPDAGSTPTGSILLTAPSTSLALSIGIDATAGAFSWIQSRQNGGTNKFPLSLNPNGGAVGINITAPTAKLHLPAGTATASTAPLKFTSGTNLTTVENGAVEYDGTNYYASSGSTRYTLARTLTNTATLDFASTAAQTSSELTITVTGAADGDVVSVGVPNAASNANGCFTARVSSSNTVSVKFNNYSSAAIDPASGTFRVSVIKY